MPPDAQKLLCLSAQHKTTPVTSTEQEPRVHTAKPAFGTPTTVANVHGQGSWYLSVFPSVYKQSSAGCTV